MDTVQDAVRRLEQHKRQIRIAIVAHAAVYLAALALFCLRLHRAAAILAAANLAWYFLVYRRMTGAYAQSAAAANLQFGLCAGLSDFTYDPKRGITAEQFRQWAMLPLAQDDNALLCRSHFSAREQDMTLEGGEITLHYPVDGAAREKFRFLSGTLLTARAACHPEGDWLLLREELLEPGAQQAFLQQACYRPAVLPEPMAQGWRLYTRTEQTEMPRHLLRSVTALADKTASLAALRLTQEGAAAFLNGRFYTGSRYPAAVPTAQRLQGNTLPERDAVWAWFRAVSRPGKEQDHVDASAI